MTIWIAIAAAVGFFGLSLRAWMEFGSQARRLQAEVDHAKRLIDDHTESLAMDRAKIDEVKQETEELLAKRNETERTVVDKRSELTGLEERLERTRPKSHRVDTDNKEDDLFG